MSSRYEPNPLEPVDVALDVQVVEGEVVFIGPGSIAFSMTASAARETSLRLARALAHDED